MRGKTHEFGWNRIDLLLGNAVKLRFEHWMSMWRRTEWIQAGGAVPVQTVRIDQLAEGTGGTQLCRGRSSGSSTVDLHRFRPEEAFRAAFHEETAPFRVDRCRVLEKLVE